MGLEGKSPQDRAAAGFFLFLTFARARFSDGQNVASLTISGCYLEAKIARSKISFSLESKPKYLPMAACIHGLDQEWAVAWMDAVTDTGVVVAEDSEDRPTLPCPASGLRELIYESDAQSTPLRSDNPRGQQFHDPSLEPQEPESDAGEDDVSSSGDSADEEHVD